MLKHSGLDKTFQALSDATRRAMVERLASGPATVSDLGGPFAMSLPAVLQHVRTLEEAGIVTTEKAGRVRWCQLNPSSLEAAAHWITERQALWESRLDALESHLGKGDQP